MKREEWIALIVAIGTIVVLGFLLFKAKVPTKPEQNYTPISPESEPTPFTPYDQGKG